MMKQFNVSDLGARDTVVIECNIARVWNKPEGKGAASWYAFLQLKTVYLIHKDISAVEDEDVQEAPEDEGLDL